MPGEGATTGTGHYARVQAQASASLANPCAPVLDDDQERRGRLLLLAKEQVLAHRLARPLAAESDENQNRRRRTLGQ
jgi:hypothetical protein